VDKVQRLGLLHMEMEELARTVPCRHKTKQGRPHNKDGRTPVSHKEDVHCTSMRAYDSADDDGREILFIKRANSIIDRYVGNHARTVDEAAPAPSGSGGRLAHPA
jgi:hypothetical protein